MKIVAGVKTTIGITEHSFYYYLQIYDSWPL